MQIAMVGLGRMGANMARRLLRAGHTVVAYDRDPAVVKAFSAEGATGADSLADLVKKLAAPRAVWIMFEKFSYGACGHPTLSACFIRSDLFIQRG